MTAQSVVMVAKFSADVTEFSTGVNKLKTDADSLKQSLQMAAEGASKGNWSDMATGMKLAGSYAVELGAGIMGAASQIQGFVAQAQQIGEAVFGPAQKAAKAMESMKAEMGGVGDASQKLYQDVQNLAIELAFPTDGLEDVAKHMLAIGVNAKNVTPELKAVGDAIAAAGGSTDNINEVIQKLNEIQGHAKVTTDDIVELTNQGVKGWDALAKGMNTTPADAMKKVQEGAVSATDAVNALVKGMEDMNKNAGQNQTDFGAQWQRFTDILGKTAAMLTGPILDAFSGIMAIINKVGEGIASLSDALANMAGNKNFKNQQDQLIQGINDIGHNSTQSAQSVGQFNASLNSTGQSAQQASSSVGGMTQTTATSTQATTQHTQATAQNTAAVAQNTQAKQVQIQSAQQIQQALSSSGSAIKSESGYYENLTVTVTQSARSVNQFTIVTSENTQAVVAASKDLNEHIKEFAKQSGISYDQASQQVKDFAAFTQQSMDVAAAALAHPLPKTDMDQWVRDQETPLEKFMDVLDEFQIKLTKALSGFQGNTSLFSGSLPGFSTGVDKYNNLVNGSMPGYASGGTNISGWGVAGENGPELINFGTGGASVTPLTGSGASSLPQLPALGGMMGNSGPLHVTLMIDGQSFGEVTFPYLAPIMRAAVGGRQ